MEKPTDNFFAQLRNLAAKIDKDCEQYKRAISEQNEEFSAPQAVKDLSDMKNDVKRLKTPLQTELDRQKKDTQTLNEITTSVDCLLENYVSQKVSEIEQYMLQYGYKPNGEMPGKEKTDAEAEENENEQKEDKDEEIDAPKYPFT